MILNASGWARCRAMGRKGRARVIAILLVSAFLTGLSSMEAWAASPQETGDLVGTVAEAMGGLKALQAIKTQVVSVTGRAWSRSRHLRPEKSPATCPIFAIP